MTVKEQIEAKVAAKLAANPRMSRAAAVSAVYKAYPNLRQQLVAEANQER